MKRFLFIALLGAASLTALADYGTNFPADKNQTKTNPQRNLNSVVMTAGSLAPQTIAINQEAGGRLYLDKTSQCAVIPAGAPVAVRFDWNGNWMNSYVYLDRGNDGQFDATLSESGVPAEGSDIMSFSHYNEINSAGNEAKDGSKPVGNTMLLPDFTLGSDMTPGLYRMRFKVDFDSVDPGGSVGTGAGDDCATRGGTIADAMALVIAPLTSVTAIPTIGEGGTVALSEGPDGSVVVTATPQAGYVFDGVMVTNDFNLPEGVGLADPSLLDATFNTLTNTVTVPASILTSCSTIEALFVDEATRDDSFSYDSPYNGEKGVNEGITSLTFNGTTIEVNTDKKHFYTNKLVNLPAGGKFTIQASCNCNARAFNIYVDYKRIGNFDKPLAEGTDLSSIGELSLPKSVKNGVYRARLEAVGFCDVDFLINVYNPTASYRAQPLNSIILSDGGQPMAETYPTMAALKLKVTPTLPGFEADNVIVRHGQNINGPEFVKGNPQWADTSLPIVDGKVTIPAEVMNGDICVYALFEETATGEWTKIWGDEFNSEAIDPMRWGYQPRRNATWNKRVANTPAQQALVNKIENGSYSSWCIATPQEIKDAGETIPMISGAINSEGKFSVVYGKIEARIKTLKHTGNFPAFWMMPASSDLKDVGLNGWPNDGEIDIWETINAEDRAYSTIHSGWTGWNNYNHWPVGPKQSSPQSSANVWVDNNLWHVYAVEWDENELRFFVDGKQIFSYKNQHYSEEGSKYYIEKVTWPFDKQFYIIINQSVGDGGWAASPETSFNYNTQFDYVRVYQKKGGSYSTSIDNNGDDPSFYVPATGDPNAGDSGIDNVVCDADNSSANAPAEYFDLNGRKVSGLHMNAGIYIERRGSTAKKIIVK